MCQTSSTPAGRCRSRLEVVCGRRRLQSPVVGWALIGCSAERISAGEEKQKEEVEASWARHSAANAAVACPANLHLQQCACVTNYLHVTGWVEMSQFDDVTKWIILSLQTEVKILFNLIMFHRAAMSLWGRPVSFTHSQHVSHAPLGVVVFYIKDLLCNSAELTEANEQRADRAFNHHSPPATVWAQRFSWGDRKELDNLRQFTMWSSTLYCSTELKYKLDILLLYFNSFMPFSTSQIL